MFVTRRGIRSCNSRQFQFHTLKTKSKPIKNSSNICQSQRQQQPVRLLVDVDAGIDDAWALFLLLRAHENPEVPLRIEAITTTHGNTSVDNVLVNVTRVLLAARVLGIPVYRGAAQAFTIGFVEDPPYFGEDGFGDAELDPVTPIVAAGHAVDKIIELSSMYRGELSVLALGPLTNFALAINRSPEITDYFAQFTILGGNIESYGVSTPTAEFNFICDAEAARTVLTRYTCPMTIVPHETFLRYGTHTYEFRVDELGSMDTPQIRLMNQAEAKMLEANKESWNVADALAAAVVLEPELLVVKTETFYCTVELNGEYTRGMMVVDRGEFLGQDPNVTIVTEIDTRLYEQMLRTAAGGPYYKSQVLF